VHSAQVALWGEVLVVVFIVAAATHLVGSSAVMFAAMEHLVSASGTVVVASEIGGLHLHRYLRSVYLWWLEILVRCHTPILGNRIEASIHVPMMFKSQVRPTI
jgi:hypothetical protein